MNPALLPVLVGGLNSPRHHHQGLRTIAIFEALKGAVVLLAGFGLLAMGGPNAGQVAETLVARTHFNPANDSPRIFIEAAAHLSSAHLWGLAGLAAAYCAVRFTEAYGLWRERRWAEWLAALSGAIYVPIEVYAWWHHPSWISAGAVIINLAIVTYLTAILIEARNHRQLVEKKT